ncbi:hypothetical protein DPMN_063982 [Dreissena polymorpha]|uniref:Uncharacterized protein n=1 Tax=Dreissena polymorpha TaxID=45954 RepID=A0A9D4HJP1_DREPO|nr:hypothetical protein DPMN_063982 [Dreissena polymorpha]
MKTRQICLHERSQRPILQNSTIWIHDLVGNGAVLHCRSGNLTSLRSSLLLSTKRLTVLRLLNTERLMANTG